MKFFVIYLFNHYFVCFALVWSKGTSGVKIPLVSNLYKLNRTTNFHLYQYHVSFNPEVISKGMRRSMLKEHIDLLGSIYMFDGMLLFLPIRLENEVLCCFNIKIS